MYTNKIRIKCTTTAATTTYNSSSSNNNRGKYYLQGVRKYINEYK